MASLLAATLKQVKARFAPVEPPRGFPFSADRFTEPEPMKEPSLSRLLRFLAIAFVCAGIFHAAAFVKPELAEPVPRWWHLLFVAVNTALALGMRTRPPGFVPAFAVYTLQQVFEHGLRGVMVWRVEGRLDWASVVSLTFVPLVLVLLIIEARTPRAHPVDSNALV
jgi:hypothetical protein